jgi:hypothetical protein
MPSFPSPGKTEVPAYGTSDKINKIKNRVFYYLRRSTKPKPVVRTFTQEFGPILSSKTNVELRNRFELIPDEVIDTCFEADGN